MLTKQNLQVQHGQNNGQCGLCGDSYSDSTPRLNEFGGIFGRGDIVARYISGSRIRVAIDLTANHLGYFVFDMCNLDTKLESEECFAANPLKLANGARRFVVSNRDNGWFNTTLQLPSNVRCSRCVLRWTYITGITTIDLIEFHAFNN